MSKAILLELNEVNFDFIKHYVSRGELPNFRYLLSNYDVSETVSEENYEELEPWIQWVTAHTGLPYSDHGVFRLGDISGKSHMQIWEHLEACGKNVGAVSPMNACNACRNPAFFVPDPWTRTPVAGSLLLKRLYDAIAQAVGENSQSTLTPKSAFWLLLGVARYARFSNYKRYLQLAFQSRRRPWSKALFLDLLLAEVFAAEVQLKKSDFSSLFLNAAAHIQHHYMFSSSAYKGALSNPTWYLEAGQDPVLDVYELYDHVIGSLLRLFPDNRLMIATGLHQDPHPRIQYYWRLKDHSDFLNRLGIACDRVDALMSRDFLVVCESESKAAGAQKVLEAVKSADNQKLFSVDNRGRDLFVMLTYPDDIGSNFICKSGDTYIDDFRKHVAFVAIKNGAHNGIGYFIDTGAPKGTTDVQFELQNIPNKICDALNVEPLNASKVI